MKTYTWDSGSGRPISLTVTMDDARGCSHQGQCDVDVAEFLRLARIAAQVGAWDSDDLRGELTEYGAWDAAELTDHGVNITRMAWIACCDVAENPADYADTFEYTD